MDDDIRALASARVEVKTLEAELAETEQALAISPLVVKCAQLEKRIGDMEAIRYSLVCAICRDARETFEATGIEHPHPAVIVREGSKRLTNWGFDVLPRVHIDDDLSAYITKEEEGA